MKSPEEANSQGQKAAMVTRDQRERDQGVTVAEHRRKFRIR
jgi:hypothetical protein